MKWTDEQQNVIDERRKNLLVSAAAGSGKTAVLTERIISLITDKDDPVDIDRMLVLTFTEAAASEMKDRIGKAIRKLLEEDPGNVDLRRQSIYLDHAHISTVHGFCSYVIRNYFHSTGIDPSLRVMDETESALLKSDVFEDFLEQKYGESDEDLIFFVKTFFTEKNADRNLKELVLKIYDFAMAAPWPKEWLEGAVRLWEEACTEEGMEKILSDYIERAYEEILNAHRETLRLIDIASSPGGPAAYLPALESDLAMYERFLEADSFDERKAAADSFSFAGLGTKKAKDEDPGKRKYVKDARDKLKTFVQSAKDDVFSYRKEDIIKEMEYCLGLVRPLAKIVCDFADTYGEAKLSRGVMDFDDMEHFALDILAARTEDGRIERTDAARELASYFAVVMTDEYQDTNEIQEMILHCVSREEDGDFNRFMVGDIKQAIYRFRHARPEIFIGKYDLYEPEGEKRRRIDLNMNFRSKKPVIDTINFIFRKLMSPEIGGIAYDEKAELKTMDGEQSEPVGVDSASQPEQVTPSGNSLDEYSVMSAGIPAECEILLLDKKDSFFEDNSSPDKYTEAEAALAAKRIKNLMKTMTVTDKETGEPRPLKYSDCVIIMRSVSASAGTFIRVLSDEGIPAYSAQKKGYFETMEVTAVLDFLRVIDNPLQDIPLTAVLFSPMVGLSADDLAKIRSSGSTNFCMVCAQYAVTGEDIELREKLRKFFDTINYFREKIVYTPVDMLIKEILKVTGFGAYTAAMPGGEQRAANLEMLQNKAFEFEKKGYKGLFLFIRYIEQMKKTKIDFGEAGLFSEGTDAVAVISVHKSKGLEYPVVILSGCARKFNKTDLNMPVLLNYDYGIGIDAINAAGHSKKTTMYKKAVSLASEKEMYGEELRILYVALTRAREKLIMTGIISDLAKKAADCALQSTRWKDRIPGTDILRAESFMDWLLMAFASDKCFEPVYDWAAIHETNISSDCGTVRIRIESAGSVMEGLSKERRIEAVKAESLPGAGDKNVYSEEARRILSEQASYVYPYKGSEDIPSKVSVSELKRLAYEEGTGDEGVPAIPEKPVFPYVPGFIKKTEKRLTAAEKGTAFHKLLENLDLKALGGGQPSREDAVDAASRTAEELFKRGRYSEEEFKSVDIEKAADFILSDIAGRMRLADLRGELKREMPFTMSVEARYIRSEAGLKGPDSDETVLIQGIIDAYFCEDGKYIIVDYNTDRNKSEEELKKLYKEQLRYYAEAVECSTGSQVTEKIIYSVNLGKEIRL